jgi:hypothetical protein
MAAPHPRACRHLLAQPDEVEAQFYEALQQADLAAADGAVGRRRRDRLRAPRRRPAGGAWRRSATASRQVFSHGPVPARPEQVRRLHTCSILRCTTWSSVIEPPAREAAAGEAGGGKPHRLGAGHQRLHQDTAGLAHGGAPRQPRLPPAGGPTRRRRRCIEPLACCTRWSSTVRRPGCRAASCRPSGRRWRRAACARGAAAALAARALGHPDADFIDVDFRPGRPARTDAGAVPRPGRLVGQPLRAGLRPGRAAGLGACGAALPRLLGRAEPGAARLPLGRPRGDRLDPGPPARAPGRGRCGRWGSRWAAMPCCAGPQEPAASAAPWCRAVAAVSSPVDLAAAGQAIDRGLQPAGLRPHVPAHA